MDLWYDRSGFDVQVNLSIHRIMPHKSFFTNRISIEPPLIMLDLQQWGKVSIQFSWYLSLKLMTSSLKRHR